MDAVGSDPGETAGNIIDAPYELMAVVRPDALLVLGDTSPLPVRRCGQAPARPHFPHGGGQNRCCDERLEATGFALDPLVRMHEPMGFHNYNKLQAVATAVALMGGLDARGSRARLRHAEGLDQGGQDHPVLYRNRGQDGVEEEPVTGSCGRTVGLPNG